MRNVKKACVYACTAFIALTGCTTSRQAHYSWSGRKPRFIDTLTLGGNGNSKVSTSVSGNCYSFKDNSLNRPYNNDNHNTAKKYDPAIANVLQMKYADMLRVVPQAITNFPLYSFIDEWYGVRYRLGGNDKTGIDCSAFVQKLYEDVFGMNLLRTAFEQFSNCAMAYNTSDLKEGDLVFFYSYTYTRTGKGRHRKLKVSGKRISHVGVYLANDHFVHASTSQGVTISSLKEDYWAQKFAGAGQVPRG